MSTMDSAGGHLDEPTLESLKIPELKAYLRKHGQHVTGRKDDLLQRAKGIAVLGLKDVNTLCDNDARLQNERRTSKLTTPLGETIPEPTSLNSWSSDMQKVPNFTDNCVYNYLVLTMKAKRQLKSKVFFQDRHVQSIEYHDISSECTYCLVKCRVIPSLPSSNKKENPDYLVWASLSKVTGNVNSADCNCTAGLGEACNHIGALLYALVDISDKRQDWTLASTSQKCQWNNPRKRRLSPKIASDMMFRKNMVPIRDELQPFKCTVNTERFRQKLIDNGSDAGWLTNFSCEQTADENTNTICQEVVNPYNLPFMYSDSKDLECVDAVHQFQLHFNSMTISREECDRVEQDTRGQSSCEKWVMLRKGKNYKFKFWFCSSA